MPSTFAEILAKSGHLAYTTRGVSMRLLLKQGRDVVNIRARSSERCAKYDAALFVRDNGQYVLHRILKVLEGGYWIVGDNCVGGEFVREEQVIGVLESVTRNGRTLSMNAPMVRFYVLLWCAPWRTRFFVLRCKGFLRRVLVKIYRMTFKRMKNGV